MRLDSEGVDIGCPTYPFYVPPERPVPLPGKVGEPGVSVHLARLRRDRDGSGKTYASYRVPVQGHDIALRVHARD